VAKLSAAQVHALAMGAGLTDKEANTMTVIAPCESGNAGKYPVDTGVENRNTNGSVDVGIWQINSVHRAKHPTWTVSWLKVPANNARAMATLFRESGTKPWGSSSSCWLPKMSTNALAGTLTDPVGAAGALVDAAASPVAALVSGLQAMLEAVNRVGAWVSEPHNWTRVAYVVGGAVVVVAAGAAIASDTKAGQTVIQTGTKAAKAAI
jgi:hypothetical protein